jgi:hypothetical protein
VILKVFADESFTNKAETLCGFVATTGYWEKFERKWNSVLRDFRADYFHFREFSNPNLYSTPGNAYYGWTAAKRDRFLNELTIVLSEEAVAVGGSLDFVKFRSLAKEYEAKDGDHIEMLIAQFYVHFSQQLNSHWPKFDGQVLFVFDETPKLEWKSVIHKIHSKAQSFDKRIGVVSFEDDRRCPPLQAADLFAYISRQIAEDYYEQGSRKQTKTYLHWILSKNHNPKFKKIHTAESWENLVRLVLAHRKQMMKLWAKEGIKRRYIPEQDFRPVAEKLGIPFIEDPEAL